MLPLTARPTFTAAATGPYMAGAGPAEVGRFSGWPCDGWDGVGAAGGGPRAAGRALWGLFMREEKVGAAHDGGSTLDILAPRPPGGQLRRASEGGGAYGIGQTRGREGPEGRTKST